MLRRMFTTILAVALACAAGLSAWASTPSAQGAGGGAAGAPAEPGAANRMEAAIGEKLRKDFSRLVTDARAGKVGVATHPRQQPAQSNNLSKKAKVTIAVVVAALVVTAVVIASKANDAPGDIRIF